MSKRRATSPNLCSPKAKTPRSPSIIWREFQKLPGSGMQCRRCATKYAGNATTNALRHLEMIHPEAYAELREEEAAVLAKPALHFDDLHSDYLFYIGLATANIAPGAILNNPYLQKWFGRAKVTLPSVGRMNNIANDLKVRLRGEITAIIGQTPIIAISTDIYTNVKRASVVRQVLDDYGISPDQLVAVTTDGASSNKATATSLKVPWFDKLYDTPLAKIREFTRHLSRSVKDKELFKSLSPGEPLPQKDCPTRWYSAYQMVVSALPQLISTQEVNEIQKILQPLSIAHELTKKFSSEHSTVVTRFRFWSSAKQRLRNCGTNEADGLLIALEQYEKHFTDHVSLEGAVFDPYVYGKLLDPEDWRLAVERILASVNDTNQGLAATMASHSTGPGFVDDDLSVLGLSIQPTRSAIEVEFDLYKATSLDAEKLSPYAGSVAKFWDAQRFVMPKLYVVASRYLTMPAASVAVERVFSICTRLASDPRRCRLHNDTYQEFALISCQISSLKNMYRREADEDRLLLEAEMLAFGCEVVSNEDADDESGDDDDYFEHAAQD
ncbi:unnamed protein product, partial [Mesorhabditis spiculigera]